ncbi:hypothetical protein NQ176_g10015 [Zarea fungicola]|uniref:Uncharacterized protein n=1 Tax=Zarea fungicola TaxID=93591 RepID=A0ACC1MIP7_9HYPO|nr:hypothetical protein NQ176_g10015 [Lecanicillium fungicola]
MKLLIVSLLSYFAASAKAAECSGNAPALPGELLHAYWDARNQMCSNTNCPYEQNCRVTVPAADANGVLMVILTRSKPPAVQGFPNCYNATDNLINQCVYDTHFLNGTWEEEGGEQYQLESAFIGLPGLPPPPPADPNTCNVAKYCAYTYNNNNCAITSWCDTCEVPVVYECVVDATCAGGAKCVNNLCCHADKLANGAADCPTTNDLQLCGGFGRAIGTAGVAAWSPPFGDIPSNLKCGC